MVCAPLECLHDARAEATTPKGIFGVARCISASAHDRPQVGCTISLGAALAQATTQPEAPCMAPCRARRRPQVALEGLRRSLHVSGIGSLRRPSVDSLGGARRAGVSTVGACAGASRLQAPCLAVGGPEFRDSATPGLVQRGFVPKLLSGLRGCQKWSRGVRAGNFWPPKVASPGARKLSISPAVPPEHVFSRVWWAARAVHFPGGAWGWQLLGAQSCQPGPSWDRPGPRGAGQRPKRPEHRKMGASLGKMPLPNCCPLLFLEW